jgi:hypothetical protein
MSNLVPYRENLAKRYIAKLPPKAQKATATFLENCHDPWNGTSLEAFAEELQDYKKYGCSTTQIKKLIRLLKQGCYYWDAWRRKKFEPKVRDPYELVPPQPPKPKDHDMQSKWIFALLCMQDNNSVLHMLDSNLLTKIFSTVQRIKDGADDLRQFFCMAVMYSWMRVKQCDESVAAFHESCENNKALELKEPVMIFGKPVSCIDGLTDVDDNEENNVRVFNKPKTHKNDVDAVKDLKGDVTYGYVCTLEALSPTHARNLFLQSVPRTYRVVGRNHNA